MTPRGLLAATAMLLGAWAAWVGAGRLVAAFGASYAAPLQQAVLFALALSLVERVLTRLAPPGDPHG